MKDVYIRELKRIVFDANMHDHFGATYPHAINCSKKRKQIINKMKKLGYEVPKGFLPL